MITRIVQMTFRKEEVDQFKGIFQSVRDKINAHPGCLGVKLLNDIRDERVFFTYSQWADEAALEGYRNSELFNSTWCKTKALFELKPKAWTLVEPGLPVTNDGRDAGGL